MRPSITERFSMASSVRLSAVDWDPRPRSVSAWGALLEGHHGRAERVEEAATERDAFRHVNLLVRKCDAGDTAVEWQCVLILRYAGHGNLSSAAHDLAIGEHVVIARPGG
jgi:hypothetical protein